MCGIFHHYSEVEGDNYDENIIQIFINSLIPRVDLEHYTEQASKLGNGTMNYGEKWMA